MEWFLFQLAEEKKKVVPHIMRQIKALQTVQTAVPIPKDLGIQPTEVSILYLYIQHLQSQSIPYSSQAIQTTKRTGPNAKKNWASAKLLLQSKTTVDFFMESKAVPVLETMV